jgi:hypothetical protein
MTRTEAQTRSELIDSRLVQSGWNVKDPTHVIEEFDILTPLSQEVAEPRTPYGGHQFSDYVLLGKDRKPLAVVEAKKTSKDASLGRERPSNTATTSRNNRASSSSAKRWKRKISSTRRSRLSTRRGFAVCSARPRSTKSYSLRNALRLDGYEPRKT